MSLGVNWNMKRGFIAMVIRMGIGVPSTTFFLAIISTLILICTGVAFAEDWPEFRGPTGQGISSEENVPTHWGPEENVVWKVPVVGQGWSSPIYVQGRVYLTGATRDGDDGDYSLNAMCYSADTGKQLWSTMVFHQASKDDAGIHGKNGHASPTPLISQGRMYVHFGHQGTACLDLEGNVLWKNNELTYNPVHGNGGSPVLAAGVLIFSCDGEKEPFIAALDAESGELRWKVDREVDAPKKFSFCTPLVIEVEGRQQVVSPGTNSVSAFDPIDGSEIWRVRYDGYSVVPRPVMGHGLLYLSTGFDKAQLLAIRVDGHGDVTDTHIAWRVKKGSTQYTFDVVDWRRIVHGLRPWCGFLP